MIVPARPRLRYDDAMAKGIRTIQKCAWGFAAMFLGVYLMDYVPGAMDANGKPLRKRVALRSPVSSLHTVLTGLAERGIKVEHVYDY
jgi:hypothetical protein